jgi:hypothetical protein
MQFTSKHTRALEGNDITVTVCGDADKDESIRLISVTLDGSSLDNRELPEGTEAYSNEFSGAGDAGPGKEHSLVVTVWDHDHKPHSSTTQWIDPN